MMVLTLFELVRKYVLVALEFLEYNMKNDDLIIVCFPVSQIIETQVGSEQLKSRLATEAVSVLHKCLVVGGWPLLQVKLQSE